MIGRRFTAILAGYRIEDHLAEPAADRVAWLSGQSSYRQSQLSPAQLGLLDEVAALGFAPLRAGFPYNCAALEVPWRKEPIVPASIRNTTQYLAARRNPGFRTELVRHLTPLFTRTSRRLLLVCGSAGLELFTAALPHLAPAPGLETLVVALGPVARRPPAHPGLRLHTIQGRGDWISRLGFPGPPDFWVDGRHLDYAASPEVRGRVCEIARSFRP